VPKKPVAAMSYGGRVRIAKLFDDHEAILNKEIRVGGWAKSTRFQKEFCFVELNDGSCFSNLQVVVNKSISGFEEVAKAIAGASFQFKGTLIKSPAKGQLFELQVADDSKHSAQVIGHSDGTYPIQGRPKLEVSVHYSRL
jgi:asparaginyl-tRNA synthetase